MVNIIKSEDLTLDEIKSRIISLDKLSDLLKVKSGVY